jgi:hypothetical protein
MPDLLASDQSGTGLTKLTMPELARYRHKTTRVDTKVVFLFAKHEIKIYFAKFRNKCYEISLTVLGEFTGNKNFQNSKNFSWSTSKYLKLSHLIMNVNRIMPTNFTL